MAEIPGHKTVDAEVVRSRLTPWFRERLGTDVEIGEVAVPEGQGFSSETVFVDVGADRFVLKAEPEGETIFMVYDLESQFRAMATVREHSDVPAAPVRWYEGDRAVLGRPFYVMDRVDGRVPPDNLPYTMQGFLLEATREQQRTLYDSSLDVLAGLHRLDVGLFGFLDRPQYGPAGLEQQMGEGVAYLEWVAGGREQPVLEAALDLLRRTLPASPPPNGLNWGDSRIGNMIYRDFKPVAVLDWEMATLGPAEVDLGWFFSVHRFFTYGIGAAELPGFPSESEAVVTYEKLLGRGVDDLDWYLLWAAFRYGVVMVRMAQKMAAAGIDSGMTEHDNVGVNFLATYL